ncbi:hypothetical protein AB7813_14725 [Tardiphaga sp. 20_F10_N6_6]|uniref:hypothetical protein n=1 Tax=Tardiphaga sp. 20_F10_N6_6 TaxID=3240788 RepID=UPI003F8874AA
MNRLASAGESLAESILQPTSGDRSSAEAARELVKQIRSSVPLSIVVSGTPLHVPWGFLYRGQADGEFQYSGDASDFDDFWVNLFDLNVSYSRTSFLAPSNKKVSESSFILHALHAENFSAAKNLLGKNEQAQIEALLNLKVGNFTDWHSCRKNWRECQDVDSIIYVFGHSDGKSIYLENGTEDAKFRMDANSFSASFRKRSNTNSRTICFLNGCRSGAGDLGSSFLSVTSSHGFYGFIGSEAEVSNTFAARYGAAFMKMLCLESASVQEAMAALKATHEFFPMNLFYTCYASPDFRLHDKAGV